MADRAATLMASIRAAGWLLDRWSLAVGAHMNEPVRTGARPRAAFASFASGVHAGFLNGHARSVRVRWALRGLQHQPARR